MLGTMMMRRLMMTMLMGMMMMLFSTFIGVAAAFCFPKRWRSNPVLAKTLGSDFEESMFLCFLSI